MSEGSIRSFSSRTSSSRLYEYKYHPAIRWLLSHGSVILLSLLMVVFIAQALNIALGTYRKYEAEPRLGAISCENKLCSAIGASFLEAGGNAADAMIGTMFCVGVLSPYHSGIGGGGFALVRGKDGIYESIDFREAAPVAAHATMYTGNLNGSVTSGLASGVPGELRGLEYIHKKYAKLSWPALLIPSIRLARDGFVVSEDLVKYMEYATKDYDFLTHEKEWAIDFAPNGTRVGLGDIITRQRYAQTLQKIAEEGPETFYTGPMSRDTIIALANANGTMTHEDLATYEVISRPAPSISYRNFRVHGCGAPASGAVALSALKTIEGYQDMGSSSARNISTHRLDEAFRFAYADRASLGDPAFVGNILAHEKKMLQESFAATRRSRISDERTLNISDYNPDGFEILPSHGTSHLVAADSSGLAISLTSTINLIFGSKLLVPTTGVIMNNQMNDFSIPGYKNSFGYAPSPSNYIQPRKRPMSSLTPTIVEHKSNGSLYYVVGSAGGSRIITATVQNIWHVLDGGMSASEALAQPRFHDQLVPNVVEFEWGMDRDQDHNKTESDTMNSRSDALTGELIAWKSESGIGTGSVIGFDNHTVAFMASRKHNVSWVPPGFSSAQSIRWCWNGTFEAASEPRQAESGGSAV